MAKKGKATCLTIEPKFEMVSAIQRRKKSEWRYKLGVRAFVTGAGLLSSGPPHSLRSASTRSTRVARRAGR